MGRSEHDEDLCPLDGHWAHSELASPSKSSSQRGEEQGESRGALIQSQSQHQCPWGITQPLSWPPRWLSGKESACRCRRPWFDPWVRRIPSRRKWQSSSVFLPGKSHGQRSLWATVLEMKVKVTQSCPTLCDPMDYTVHGILQARILE